MPISPALLPKISPSIKPLLPGGSSSADEAAELLLTAKSNYQRIIEGSTLAGMSFPSELSTNLTSKRTSHKIAEQGRRNRINLAIQEIAMLLPKPPPREDDTAVPREGGAAAGRLGSEPDDGGNKSEGARSGGGSGNAGSTGASTPNTKASTVEMAIDYIRQLQKEVADANRRAHEAEKKLGLRQEMAGG